MDAVLKLLEELEDILDQSRAVPFSNKVAVDKDEIYDIIAEIRLGFQTILSRVNLLYQKETKYFLMLKKRQMSF